MKNLRQFCAAAVLTLALAASAAAGDIHTGVTSPPPPQPASMAQTGMAQTDGTMHTGVTGSEPKADTLTGIALTLMQSVLSLF